MSPTKHQTIIDLVKEISGQKNTLTLPRIFIKIAGDTLAGVFLSEVVWNSDKSARSDGFFWKKAEDWQDELELSYAQVKRLATKLEDAGLIETKLMRAFGAPTMHYRPIMDAITKAILDFLENRQDENSTESKMDSAESEESIDFRESEESITTLSTPTTTRKEGAKAPSPPPTDKPKRQVTGKNALKAQLADDFEMTAIPLPALNTKRQARTAGVRWFAPLLVIAAACDDDRHRAREVMREAIKQMDDDDLTISAPQSIENVAIGIAARCKREREEQEQRTASIKASGVESEAILAQRQAEAAALDPDYKLALDTWASACEFLEHSLPKGSYSIYIKPLEVLQPNGAFRLQAPTQEVFEFLEYRLRPAVERALFSTVGREVAVEFVAP